MRFDAKFTAVFAAALLNMSLMQATPSHAETNKHEQPKTALVAKTTDTKKTAESKKTDTEQTQAPVPKPAEPKKVTVQAGDSLQSIADANQTSWTRIFDANDALTNPDTINPGDVLVIPTADQQLPDRYAEFVAQQQVIAQQQAATTAQTTSYTTRSYSSAPVSSSSYYIGNGMWCTDYVHLKRPDVPIYGNAGYNWISAAEAQGKATGTNARAGAVAVTNGHVAYVDSVNADGSYNVSEMGWNYQAGNFNKRTVQPGAFGEFIY